MDEIKRATVKIEWKHGEKSGTYQDEPGQPSLWWDDERGDWCYYLWEEGNWACDCNRAKKFGIGDDFPCGNTIEIISMEAVGEDVWTK